ncbi:FdhF/YdeP family oxidoreductase [Nocardioides jishulii]|uniref:FdhF/YdeP family oxidoreductase n=1 Tax=Nocardioides jishulii TaxID=2575440 RepID=A0A4U2YU74_9ACTN|nr:FdhF/YdeP family oxidoreductase [Nocardioides jishulii]QCX28642.1 FdhF/YdeP family oxidoreductase [Nocardioides jishulii]TKI64465.1 FdhF/YdeP family oxidoreductase [Nocardioides jishulii]
MAKPPSDDVDESGLRVGPPAEAAAGVTGVRVALEHATGQMGVPRAAVALTKLNQVDGFDCQGCAWPDPGPGDRHHAEFCENGAKAVAEEATQAHVGRDFFAEHSVEDLRGRSEYWLGKQGRIVEPVVLRPGASHYEPIEWGEAFALVAEHLKALDDPHRAAFYTSGKASNEAAFVYQLFVRSFGTNNLPDCSNMCHESSGDALRETIGIGKGSVTLEDIHSAELIVVMGQNPGTNHPRMLSALETAKRNGARIVSVNPLREPGTMRFKNPQKPRGVIGKGTELADLHVPVRLNGDLALFQAVGAALVAAHDRGEEVLDTDFIDGHTVGFERWADHVRSLDHDAVRRATGLDEETIAAVVEEFKRSRRTIICWAMGITQHKNAVATVKEIVNVALAQGNIGKRGAGVCPVRGHSNVQGDRTMGIWERPPGWFLDAVDAEFAITSPREHGLDTVATIEALRDGHLDVFFALGGNFVSAAPDTAVVEEAMGNAALTVHVATKLNRSHLAHGRTALVLPPLGRSEKDRTGGREQRITVEDSMSAVHTSRGPLEPASEMLRSEVDIVCSLALATLGEDHVVPWDAMRRDYTEIRRRIARVVPGCDGYEELADRPGGFTLPHPPRDSRTFPTVQGKAVFSPSPLEVLEVPEGHLLLQTLRSHDQFNTTIYGLDDRYRGIKGGRRVVFVHPADLRDAGLVDGDRVDLVSVWDGVERRVHDFRVVPYDQPRGCAAAYYPETNPLVPLDHLADGSRQPASKSIVVRLDTKR